jgi:cytochrome P450
MRLTDFATPAFFENPYPTYQTLRAEGVLVQVAPNVLISGRYDIVDTLLHDRRMGRNYMESIRILYGDDAPKMPLFQGFSRMFLLINPPAHTLVRSLLMKVFTAHQLESMRAVAQTTAHSLLDRFQASGGADLTAEFAFPLPVEIICRMLDLPVEHAQQLGGAASKIAKVFEPAPLGTDELQITSAAYEELARYFDVLIEERRAQPGSDLISMLISVEENGQKLSHDEIVSNVILLFLAGHETTSNMIGNILLALHRNPQQLERLKGDHSRIPKAVLECLRYDGSVQMAARSALEDVDMGGTQIARGTVVFLSLGAANRDPAKFTEPDRLDIARNEGRVLTFGAGIHHCLGYRLALIELETALQVLLERLPQLRLTGLDTLSWNRRGNLRGVDSLMAQW